MAWTDLFLCELGNLRGDARAHKVAQVGVHRCTLHRLHPHLEAQHHLRTASIIIDGFDVRAVQRARGVRCQIESLTSPLG